MLTPLLILLLGALYVLKPLYLRKQVVQFGIFAKGDIIAYEDKYCGKQRKIIY